MDGSTRQQNMIFISGPGHRGFSFTGKVASAMAPFED
jgi:hypothetical protein